MLINLSNTEYTTEYDSNYDMYIFDLPRKELIKQKTLLGVNLMFIWWQVKEELEI